MGVGKEMKRKAFLIRGFKNSGETRPSMKKVGERHPPGPACWPHYNPGIGAKLMIAYIMIL